MVSRHLKASSSGSVKQQNTNKSLTDVYVAVRVRYTFGVVQAVASTRIVSRPVTSVGHVFEVVIGSIGPPSLHIDAYGTDIECHCIRRVVCAGRGDIFDHATVDTPCPPFHQTPSCLRASDPVVDVGLDHELVPKLLPQGVVQGVVVGLTRGGPCRRRDVSSGVPVWARRHGIRAWDEMRVIGEGVAVDECPPPTFGLHVTVGLEDFAADLEPVLARRGIAVVVVDVLARAPRVIFGPNWKWKGIKPIRAQSLEDRKEAVDSGLVKKK